MRCRFPWDECVPRPSQEFPQQALPLQRGVDRLVVGIGMIPRGEVGLIFANIGLGLSVNGERVIEGATFSAVVLMVIVTTVVTPPALKWAFARRR